jgi:hypothetical protein
MAGIFTFIPATFAFHGSPEPRRLLLPGRLLLFLQSLLLNVSLLQLFRLLLMPLLHLLLTCFAGILLRQPLMFLIRLLCSFWRSCSCFENILWCCCWYLRSRFGSPVLAAAGRSKGGMPSGFLFPESPQKVGWPALLAESRWLRLHHDELDNWPVS